MILRGEQSGHQSVCLLAAPSPKTTLYPGMVPAISPWLTYVAPIRQRLRWKLLRTQKSQRFTKIGQASPGGSEFSVLGGV